VRTPALLLVALWVSVAAAFGACAPMESLRDAMTEPATAHERYGQALIAAGLDSTALGRDWLNASDSALRAPLGTRLPAREQGAYAPSEARAVAYRVSLRDGQRLQVRLRSDGLPARLYLDLYEVTTDSVRPFVHRATADTAPFTDSTGTYHVLSHEARRDAEMIVRLQPELLRAGRYELTLEAEPSLMFPVLGHGNRAIQSFFGVERDAGRRVHHGIDIFAPRGTPVLAATDGVVRSTEPNNLGGKVVWLLDTLRRQSLYYAHLDGHAVVAGQAVRRGDTLGFVGNTGNARTTAPHLHFGIYRRGDGPIDPLAHVRLISATPPAIGADISRLGTRGVVGVANATLREAPSTTSAALREVPDDTFVQIMGVSDRWYRVQFDDGTAGYLTAGAIRRADP
jgi:peptidoglycan LD-endopeptidase LytH